MTGTSNTARRPLVSAIIPAYNSERFLPLAITSVLAQTYAPMECIVVDDGSSDGTARVVASFGDRVRYIHQTNAGASAARNTGIAAARGEYIAFLDSDDYWVATRVENQMEAIAREPGLVLLASSFVAEPLVEQDSLHVPHGEAFRADALEVFNGLTELLRDSYLGTSTVIARTDALCAIGGFDVTLPIAEDLDLYFRLCRNSRYGLLRQPLVGKRLRADSLSTNLRGYSDNLCVMDRVEQLLQPEQHVEHELLRAQRLRVYDSWVSDLLMRGDGQNARQVLRMSRRVGRIQHYYPFLIKSLIAPVLPGLRSVRATLLMHSRRTMSR
ncbi:glycosyltransferase [Azohydromonas australica]|uniref:glycosyltransferase n=1 Tax=Azohydromonas australica TaxID=364039 RepID=UPI000420A118|nr:glycosyltransferase [Azohydromonas australica]